MVDTQGPSSTTLLDQLANLDPQERREVATIYAPLLTGPASARCPESTATQAQHTRRAWLLVPQAPRESSCIATSRQADIGRQAPRRRHRRPASEVEWGLLGPSPVAERHLGTHHPTTTATVSPDNRRRVWPETTRAVGWVFWNLRC